MTIQKQTIKIRLGFLLVLGTFFVAANGNARAGEISSHETKSEIQALEDSALSVDPLIQDDDELPVPSQWQQAKAKFMLSLMAISLRSPYGSKPAAGSQKKLSPHRVSTPLVVQAPARPTDWVAPTTTSGSFPTDSPNKVPEPASLISGLVGSSVALATWWKKRRSKSLEVSSEV